MLKYVRHNINFMRCFVAIDIPRELGEKIEKIQKEIESNSIKLAKDFHITLKFLGELNENKISEIINCLEKIKEKKFEIEIKNLGTFPNEKYIRVLWLGCNSSKLIELARKVRSCLKGLGDEEEFTPHITIARIKGKPQNSIYNFISKYKNIEIGRFEVKEFKLKKSILTPSGAIYSDLHIFGLLD